jgi:hypothetical protein
VAALFGSLTPAHFAEWGVRVDWKTKAPPVPRWQYGFWAWALLLYSCYLVRQARSDLWGLFGFQVIFLFVGLVISSRGALPFSSGFVEFDGERLDFSGNAGGWWSLTDVDSVMIQDRLIQIRVYRPGGTGDEFTARAEGRPPENWAALTALCRRIQGQEDLRGKLVG